MGQMKRMFLGRLTNLGVVSNTVDSLSKLKTENWPLFQFSNIEVIRERI